MKDLKHLIYFERLLENADNELIEKKKAEGGICLGYTCFHIPEVILNVDKCFSTRLRAPNTGSIDIATYYMSNYTCEYARALLERAIEGGYQFFKITDYTIEGYRRQMRVRVLDRLTEVFGVDTSDDALRKAVEEHNEVCRIISEIGQLRKRKNPVITGYEFHVLNLVTYVCPKSEILPYLRETLEEIKARRPDRKNPFRARVAIVGSEIDDPNLTKLIEGCGALVVSDRYCFGSTPGREVIELNDKEDVLTQICRHYMEVSECARYISDEKVMQRRETSDRLAKEYGAEGIIYEQMKYCDYWGFERALVSHIMHDEYGWPVLSIDRLYNNGNSGQLRTRCQAFVESLEIKRIHKEEGVE